ncbi:MAG TPA: fimbria/pilus outer membrane usher protein [Rhodanobacteraceae bacterium]|nr:fimbria/pilus outer membrane usher protein [Rhodanobacteraceae bacterium]
MESRSSKRFRATICLASALLAPTVAVAATDSVPDSGAAMDSSGIAVIPDASTNTGGNSAGEDLYLEVELNGNDSHQIAHFVHEGEHFRASAETLRKLGFRLPADAPETLELDSLAGVAVHYDEAAQRLQITAPFDLLNQSVAVLNTRANPIPHPQASPGLLLNYDLYATRDNVGDNSLSAFTELRAFNAWGVLSNTALSRVNDTRNSGTQADSVRLDTTFSHSFVDSALTLRVGDVITGSLDWTRATRFGGIQLQRNFALQPDLVTFPVPAFYGQANLPSTVDLYVNGLKQYSSEVPAGPFQLNTVPIVNGNGQAQVVITDALGRQSSLAFPFYTANQLLRGGLSDYSLDAGFVRKDYGINSFSYASDPAVSGIYRYGVRDWLTVEGHAEATAGLSNAGVGATVEIGRAGIVNGSFAESRDRGATGSQAELGYNWRNERFNFSLDSLRTFGSFRDVASRFGPPPPQRSDRALAGLTMGTLGSLGVSYVNLQYPEQPRSRFASAFYFKSLGSRASFNLSINQNIDDHSDRSVFLGVSIALDHHISGSITAQHDRNGNLLTADASKPVNPDGGFGWRVRAQTGENENGGQAEVGYRGEQGQILAGVQSFAGSTLGYADLSGALVFMDNHVFIARRIDDAFAVVSTDGVAGVPVKLENRPIGTTNSGGDLLVTPINAYQRNKLSIDPMLLPADVHIDRIDADVVPSDRAGTLVKFGIQPIHAASVILHDSAGKVINVGSAVTLGGSDAPPMVVGYDGIVYLEGLSGHNVLKVQTSHGTCTASFDYHPKGKTVPIIGPLVCREEQP